MAPPPSRTLLGPVFCLTALLTVSACSAEVPAEPPATATSRPARPPSPSQAGAPALTEAQARAALITQADLGDPWMPTQGAATWRDTLLKAKTDVPDCQRLLDALYTEEVLGPDARTRATTGLDDGWDSAQLRYQILARPRADVDRTLTWLRTLPRTCEKFTARTERGVVQSAEVTEAALPAAGDGRQGLRITLSSEDPDGESTTLTVDMAAVRVGDDAISLTNGGLGNVSSVVTEAVVQRGAERLAEIQKRGRAEV